MSGKKIEYMYDAHETKQKRCRIKQIILPLSRFIILHGVTYRLPIDRPLLVGYCSYSSIMPFKAFSTALGWKKNL